MKQHTSMAVVAALLVTGWLAMARAFGMFLPSSARIDGKDRPSSAFARSKRFVDIDGRKVAYVEAGDGEPLTGLMKHLQIERAKFVAYDHGGAVALLMMDRHADKIERLVLTNIEAYDQWPSQPELKYLKMIVNPVTSPIVFTALKSDWVRHRIFRIAVHDERTLNPHILAEWVTPHTASGKRWQRLRRFFRWQPDREHNSVTQSGVPSMRRFDKATLLVWGEQDTNFGPVLAKRLARDIPGATGNVWMKNSAHMPMVEEPQAYADTVLAFMKDAEMPHSQLLDRKMLDPAPPHR